MESVVPELALYGSKNESTKTNTVLLPISEVSTVVVSLIIRVPHGYHHLSLISSSRKFQINRMNARHCIGGSRSITSLHWISGQLWPHLLRAIPKTKY